MIANDTVLADIISPVRQVQARVEMYDSSTLVGTFSHTDRLISVNVERIGDEGKFFGLGVAQKANIHIIDVNREITVTTDNSFKIYFNEVDCLPMFYVTEVNRDENTNELSITAYDVLNKADLHTVSELGLNTPTEEEPPVEEEVVALAEETTETGYTILEFATACSTLLGLSGVTVIMTDATVFDTSYPSGANFDGTETIREALTAVAEATQTVYYINYDNNLVFKRLDVNGDPVYTIDKSQYITLDSKTNRKLSTIYHTTELGDDVYASITEIGSTQYVRDNPFWNLREDIATIVDNALAAVGGMTANQFDCEWRGNFLIEIGDKISLITKDNDTVYSYLLDDTMTYDGSYSQNTQWDYVENDTETSDNPTSIGDAIKQTYARVDKINQRIDLVASDVKDNAENISSLRINAEEIEASVKLVEENVNDTLGGINNNIETLTKQVEATMSAEDIKFEIQSSLENGVTKVQTNTGFTFNDEGLTIEKTGSEIKTQITEDGMTVYRNDEEVLVANNVGVNAANLHATTYLIIGTNSRFEDYMETRTGCFWIGGSE